MVEPYRLERVWMPGHRRPYLSSAQAISRLPLHLNARLTAVSFYFRLVRRVKTALPRQTHAVAKVPHQHPAFFGEALSDAAINSRKYTSHIGDGSFSSALGWLDAMEPDQLGPGRDVGQLVVKSDGLI